MRLVKIWLLLLASVALNHATSIKHIEFSIEREFNKQWRDERINVDILCKIAGPQDLFIVWREKCIDSNTHEPSFLQQPPWIREGNPILEHDSACNETMECDITITIESKYSRKHLFKDLQCTITCCGYAEVVNATRIKRLRIGLPVSETKNDRVVTSSEAYLSVVSKSQLQKDVYLIWPHDGPFPHKTHSTSPDRMIEGVCRGVTATKLGTASVHPYYRPPLSVEFVVYSMVGLSVFSLVASCSYIFMAEGQSNQAKSRQFRDWAERQRRRSLHRARVSMYVNLQRAVTFQLKPARSNSPTRRNDMVEPSELRTVHSTTLV